MVSVIIPARNEPYLSKTVQGLLDTAKDEIEIFVVLDGAPRHPEDPEIETILKNVTYIYNPKPLGIRRVVNRIVPMTNGKFIVKLDAHCKLKPNWDWQLKYNWEPGTLQVPTRYSLDAKKWKRKNKPPVEYLYLTYPYTKDDMGYGFHGRKMVGETMGPEGYYAPEIKYKKKRIDEIMIFQGSMWFMSKEDFIKIDCFDERFDNMWQEPLELSLKMWLSGRKVLRNKNTWYAHWHKNTDEGGRGWRASKAEQTRVNKEVADYWMNNSWEGQIYPISWYVEKFNLKWPEGWNKNLNNNLITHDATDKPIFGTEKQSKHESFDEHIKMPPVETTPATLILNPKARERKKSMLSSKEVHGALKALFRVKRGDIPPYTGWKKPSTREDLYDCMEGMNQIGIQKGFGEQFHLGAEIGVAEGNNARAMMDRIPNCHLIAVDPWEPYARWSQEKMDRRYAKCVRRCEPYGGRIDIIRKRSLDHVKDVPNASLDWVYLDGFHEFDWIMQDIINWAPKVRKGGIVAGHDYYPFYRSGVIEAVDVYVKTHNIREWYVTRERHSSFFWVA